MRKPFTMIEVLRDINEGMGHKRLADKYGMTIDEAVRFTVSYEIMEIIVKRSYGMETGE